MPEESIADLFLLRKTIHFEPRIDLPVLPTEIWLTIMREATAMLTDPLDPTQNDQIFEDDVPSQYQQYRNSLATKCALTLVSKGWYRLAQEVLYEFIWISSASQAKALASTLLHQSIVQGLSFTSGQHIRRLHIETIFCARCDPADIRVIFDHATQLLIYSDHFSVRRNRLDESRDPRCEPYQMLSALAHPKNQLRRLSWTNYDGVPFHFHMSSPLQNTADNLEYLELCIPSFTMMCGDVETAPVISLPVLRSLKVTLDDTTFAILARWKMPLLSNLFVISSDFDYSGTGFVSFFESHGSKLIQLELGHSSRAVEEHNLTSSHPQSSIPLDTFCPNLRHFICGADAEWNWQDPDWIPPHVLLPRHAKLEFIGIRDIHNRLLGPPRRQEGYFSMQEQLLSLLKPGAFPSLRVIRDLSPASDKDRIERPWDALIGFWLKIANLCEVHDVRLENYRGREITTGQLRQFLVRTI
jgi:hypothetical protein